MKKTLFRGLLGAALTILVCLPAASRGKGPKKTCEFTDADFRTEKILEALPIRATFLDEVSWDIPHQNWGVKEWDADFKAMKQMGINTVVLIRAGLGSWIAVRLPAPDRKGQVSARGSGGDVPRAVRQVRNGFLVRDLRLVLPLARGRV